MSSTMLQPAPPVSFFDFHEIFFRVVNSASGAQFFANFAFFSVSRRREDCGAKGSGNLDCGRADPAGPAVYQYAVAGSEVCTVEKVGPDREEILRYRRRAYHVVSAGQRQRLRFGY